RTETLCFHRRSSEPGGQEEGSYKEGLPFRRGRLAIVADRNETTDRKAALLLLGSRPACDHAPPSEPPAEPGRFVEVPSPRRFPEYRTRRMGPVGRLQSEMDVLYQRR